MARSTLVGTQKFTAKLDDLSKESRARISDAVKDSAERVAADAAISITTGSISGKGHIPSRPGEPPNADTRQLDTSITVEKVGELAFNVVVKAPYAKPLEYGTSRMAARPFLAPAERKNRPETIRNFFGAIKRARGL